MINQFQIKKDGRGGARINSGRKTKAEESKVTGLCLEAIVEVYGSEKDGFVSLLQSGEAVLIKWVFEHRYGKPKESIELSGKIEAPIIIFNQSENCDPIQ